MSENQEIPQKDDLMKQLKVCETLSLFTDIQARLGRLLPDDYVQFISTHDGAIGFVGHSYVSLWPVADLISLNEEHEILEYVPQLFAFGSDGGNELYCFDLRYDSMPVVQVPMIGMAKDTIEHCASSFTEFLEWLEQQEIDDSPMPDFDDLPEHWKPFFPKTT